MSDRMMKAVKRRMQTTVTNDGKGPIYHVDVQGDGQAPPQTPPPKQWDVAPPPETPMPDPMMEPPDAETQALDAQLDALYGMDEDVEALTPAKAAQIFDITPQEAERVIQKLIARDAEREGGE